MQVLQMHLGLKNNSCNQNEVVALGLSIKVWCYNEGISWVFETPQGFLINVCRKIKVLHCFKKIAIFDLSLQLTWKVL